ncbi:MAG: DUF4258 domain-containing protein [Acidobacteria bacterium]|nr:DUF4258 domain-containing protein [Acidobacteriota bacterium]
MSEAFSFTSYRLTDHARLEMARRHITEAEIAQVLAAPEQIERLRPGRIVAQSRLPVGEPPRRSLLRVVVDVDRQPPDVVTAYRTSKLQQYWRRGP